MSKVLGHIAKKYVLHYFLLKVGHAVVRTYLAKIGIIKNPQ